MLRPAHRPVPAVLPALVTTALVFFATCACAQSEYQLDNLVFDPVLLVNGSPVDDANLPGVSTSILRDLRPQSSSSNSSKALLQEGTDRATAIAAYLEEMAELERLDGQYAGELTQILLALGMLYQQQGNHEQAIAAFERADHISRVNNGLYHPGQIPIIEGLVESLLAVGDFEAVNEMQGYLLFLNTRLRENGSIAPVATLADLGDYNMRTLELALLETNRFENMPMFGSGGAGVPGTAEIARYHSLDSLMRARRTYSAAIATIIDNGNLLHPRLFELEYKLLETSFLLGYSGELVVNPHYYLTSARKRANTPNRWSYLRNNDTGYQAGIEAFGRILQYLESTDSITAVDRVRAHIEYGDWHLVFGWDEAAAAEYGRAYALAGELGLSANIIDSLFIPALPVQLPLFTPGPNSREKFGISEETELAYDGHIDVRFSLTRNGSARGIRMLDKSAGTTFAIEERLSRFLKNSPFRPWVVDGELASRDAVTVRYHYSFR